MVSEKSFKILVPEIVAFHRTISRRRDVYWALSTKASTCVPFITPFMFGNQIFMKKQFWKSEVTDQQALIKTGHVEMVS